MEDGVAQRWYQKFMEALNQHPSAPALKDASLRQQLGKWTELMTAVVVATCQGSCWAAAARGHRSRLLVVGSRDDAGTFPYRFFKDWLFDLNVGRFSRI